MYSWITSLTIILEPPVTTTPCYLSCTLHSVLPHPVNHSCFISQTRWAVLVGRREAYPGASWHELKDYTHRSDTSVDFPPSATCSLLFNNYIRHSGHHPFEMQWFTDPRASLIYAPWAWLWIFFALPLLPSKTWGEHSQWKTLLTFWSHLVTATMNPKFFCHTLPSRSMGSISISATLQWWLACISKGMPQKHCPAGIWQGYTLGIVDRGHCFHKTFYV